MSMVILIADELRGFDSEMLHELSSLGVSTITLLEGASTAAVLIQGWALDTSSIDQVTAIVTSGDYDVQVFRPVMETSVIRSRVPDATAGEARPEGEDR